MRNTIISDRKTLSRLAILLCYACQKSSAHKSCDASYTRWQQCNFCQNHGHLIDEVQMTTEQRVPSKEGLFFHLLTKKAVLHLSYNYFERFLSRKEDLQQFSGRVSEASFICLSTITSSPWTLHKGNICQSEWHWS